MRALDAPMGIILRITGGDASRRHSAIAAISAAKRELQIDEPALLNIQVQAVPGKEDEIALLKYGNPE